MKHSPILNIKEELTMKIIKPSHTHISKKGLTPYQFVEKIGRTCYKSEDKITEDSAVKFVKGLCQRQHYAMIEHHWVHLLCYVDNAELLKAFREFEDYNIRIRELLGYLKMTTYYGTTFISAPLRTFFELMNEGAYCYESVLPTLVDEMLSAIGNAYPEISPYQLSYRVTKHFKVYKDEDEFIDEMHCHICEGVPSWVNGELMKHKTHTVLFVCDRGVSHELVRHRPVSFAQESTRYCNYTHGKFDGEITVIEPFFFMPDGERVTTENWSERYGAWRHACEVAEESYNRIIADGGTAQEARSVLPNSLKTEIIMTCNETEWQHIVNLRSKGTTGAPHPQMKEVMTPWYEELKTLSGGRVQ